MRPPATSDELEAAAAAIEAWAAAELADNPVVAAVERHDEDGVRRWFVRVHGEDKDVWSLWLTLRQRWLHHETYVLPAPEEDHARYYEQFLRRNRKLDQMAFSIGPEEAIFLQGQIPVHAVDAEELDRILGSTYAYVEACFRPALRIGFASLLAQRGG